MSYEDMLEIDKETSLFIDYIRGKIPVAEYREKSIQYQEERERHLKKMGLLSETESLKVSATRQSFLGRSDKNVRKDECL